MSNQHDLEDLTDEEALFEELERDDDFSLAMIREKRIKEIQEELERRQAIQESNHGIYMEITDEKEFMDITVKEKYMVGHFYHKDFRRCRIMDTHLEKLAPKYFDTRFVKINVDNAPFLIEKLQIRVLPCVFAWIDGYIKVKMVGFDELGNKDDFATPTLELQLANCGVIRKKEEKVTNTKKSIFQANTNSSDDDDDDY
ncbi:unnamed protein product [Cunninghamella echinulata]